MAGRFLARTGWPVPRFWNNEILSNTDGIIAVIRDECWPVPGAALSPDTLPR